MSVSVSQLDGQVAQLTPLLQFLYLNPSAYLFSNSGHPLPLDPRLSLGKSLTMSLLGQLNFNQGQLCLLPPAEGAAGGEKGKREQQEGRRVYSWWWATQWRLIIPSHSATIICGFALPNAWEITFSIFSQQLLSFWRCLLSSNWLRSCGLIQIHSAKLCCLFSFPVNFKFELMKIWSQCYSQTLQALLSNACNVLACIKHILVFKYISVSLFADIIHWNHIHFTKVCTTNCFNFRKQLEHWSWTYGFMKA